KVCQRLGEFYYRVRKGIGFNKTPAEFGAFPTDPYSHNPRHAGAQQPGMTGQAKEEVLTRFGELGLRISGGALRVQPSLLRLREFVDEPRTFRFLNIDDTWQEVAVPRAGLAFSWCQVPIIYTLDANTDPGLTITCDDGKQQNFSGMQLPADISVEVFRRGGRIRQLNAVFGEGLLFAE
ncbi:MAG: hypothetical protein KJO19_04010, partial [Woeseia sp.]|nr:hypothetical protein [Woeseia sp.]